MVVFSPRAAGGPSRAALVLPLWGEDACPACRVVCRAAEFLQRTAWWAVAVPRRAVRDGPPGPSVLVHDARNGASRSALTRRPGRYPPHPGEAKTTFRRWAMERTREIESSGTPGYHPSRTGRRWSSSWRADGRASSGPTPERPPQLIFEDVWRDGVVTGALRRARAVHLAGRPEEPEATPQHQIRDVCGSAESSSATPRGSGRPRGDARGDRRAVRGHPLHDRAHVPSPARVYRLHRPSARDQRAAGERCRSWTAPRPTRAWRSWSDCWTPVRRRCGAPPCAGRTSAGGGLGSGCALREPEPRRWRC